jgi:serine/threonine protein kinase
VSDSSDRKVVAFTEALRLPAEQRGAYLEHACASDLDLRRQVEALLRTYDQVGDFLEESQTSFEGKPESAVGGKPGDRIGRYKLLQQIGEGGCGVVFMAEQEEPVRRRVALKIIKPGMDTRNVIARFEAEQQALALMDHPNIAKVFDAGATESGRPYFVMELVRGVKITDYCDHNSLTTEGRLKLFAQVCQAVQHAHQKGIIHRDIKPSNILVTTSSECTALPMVIDFGIAKATTNQQLTDKTLFTAFEMLIGTPAYMSPEQAALTSVDVDTRTDIYSLGVLLYELLTGSTPFETAELLKVGLDEIRRAIRELEPLRPSTKLSEMTGANLTAVAQRRNSEPPRLIRSISGDLDWIAMKALEKDRARRYATANDLALDVQRFLAREAVSARPPSALYKFQKAVLRNRLLFAGIGIIAVLLVVSLIVVSASLARERQARHEAVEDKQRAQTEAAKSQQITQFLEEMLQGVGPSVARGKDTAMLREILDRTAERIGTEMTNQPLVEVEIRSLIGRLYQQIGNYDRAEKMHRETLVIYRKLSTPESPAVAAALYDLGLALRKEGKLTEAEGKHQEALAIRRRFFGNEHTDVAASLNDLAVVLRHQKKYAESESLTQESLRIRRKLFGNEHLDVADSLRNLAYVFGDEGKYAESQATAQEVLDMRQKLLGPEHALVAAAILDLAWATGWTDKVKAESLQREALAMQRKVLGDEHPDVSISLSSLGERLRQRGNLTEAHALTSAALSVQRKVLGENSPAYIFSLASLALTLEQEDKWVEAEAAHREGLALWRKQGVGTEHPQALGELEGLVRALVAQKKFPEAEALLAETLSPAFIKQPASSKLLVQRVNLRGRQGLWPEAAEDASLTLEYDSNEHYRYHTLAPLLVITRDIQGYRALCRKIISRFTETSNPYVAERVTKDCLLLPDSGVDLPSVAKLAEKAITLGGLEKSLPDFQVAKALSEYRQGHFAEAVEWGKKTLSSSQDYARAHAFGIVAMALWRLNQTDEARAMLAEGDALAKRLLPIDGPEKIGSSWVAWLIARIALDEAAALIQPAPPKNN